MTRLVYKVGAGDYCTYTTNYACALAMVREHPEYKMTRIYEPIPETKGELSEKRKALRVVAIT